MSTKFYVGQRVRSDRHGEGVVVTTIYTKWFGHNIYAAFPSGNFCSYRSDGTESYGDVLTPIDPPRVVLTEWQRKEMKKHFIKSFGFSLYENDFDYIESILSEPEPPKYQPKQGEAVLVKVNKEYPWIAAVFSNMEYEAYKCYGGMYAANYCIPFDPEKVGKITND